jgi:hypothetical protein
MCTFMRTFTRLCERNLRGFRRKHVARLSIRKRCIKATVPNVVSDAH